MEAETILAEEAHRVAQLARARQCESAKNVVTNLVRAIDHAESRLDPFTAQQKIFGEMESLVGKMSGDIPGSGGMGARHQIIIQLTAGRNWIQNRLEKDTRQIADQKKKLVAAEAIVAEFDA